MKRLWQQFLASLTLGVRVMLVLLTGVYLAAIIGGLSQAYDLNGWLIVSGPAVWHGQVWRLITYALAAGGPLNFLMNLVALVMIGGQLERHWTRSELWWCSTVSALGAGLVAAGLNAGVLSGAAPMMFGLLIAWAYLAGNQVALFPIFGEMSVRQAAYILAGVSLLIMFFTAGWLQAAIMAAGGFSGWLYVWVRYKWIMSRASRTVDSGRINRLEL